MFRIVRLCERRPSHAHRVAHARRRPDVHHASLTDSLLRLLKVCTDGAAAVTRTFAALDPSHAGGAAFHTDAAGEIQARVVAELCANNACEK
jgi:hypothetical protein